MFRVVRAGTGVGEAGEEGRRTEVQWFGTNRIINVWLMNYLTLGQTQKVVLK